MYPVRVTIVLLIAFIIIGGVYLKLHGNPTPPPAITPPADTSDIDAANETIKQLQTENDNLKAQVKSNPIAQMPDKPTDKLASDVLRDAVRSLGKMK